MALRERGQFWCPLLTPDEFSALIGMAKGPWGDQQGCQVDEDYMRLTDKNEFKLKPKVLPAQSPGNAREYKNFIPGSAGSQRSGPWNLKVNLVSGSRWGVQEHQPVLWFLFTLCLLYKGLCTGPTTRVPTLHHHHHHGLGSAAPASPFPLLSPLL